MTGIPPPGRAALHLVRAAVLAPSIHNTQPWLFVGEERDHGVELYADPARRLPLTDPGGREMTISCGAALFNLRLAVRNLGFTPHVTYLSDPLDATFLARVGWGPYAAPGADETRMLAALPHRHTARGPLRSDPLPTSLINDLRRHAQAEGATLHVLEDPDERRRLANVVRAAENIHRTTSRYAAELAHWTRPPGRRRPDGIPDETCAHHPDCTPFAQRDYTRLTRVFPTPPWQHPSRTGLVCVLTTAHDDRLAWLRAGQALQRVLLHAAAHHVMAGFHTQPLELSRLRARVTAGITHGETPQMILRLGYSPHLNGLPRRPPGHVLVGRADAHGVRT